MNKLLTKIVGIALGATMAIGVGVAIGSASKSAVPAHATDYTSLFSIGSGDVVSGSSYQAHTATVATRGWVITFGGNNSSVGTNSSNRGKCNLSNYSKYAVSPVTTSSVASAFANTTSVSDVGKITYSFSGGSNQTNTNVYLLYSSNNTTFSQMSLTSGTQGAAISSGTSFEFAKCTGYFAVLFEATNSSGNWRIDAVSLSFYSPQAPSTCSVTYDGNGNTGGSAPTDATAYTNGATVTVADKPDGLVKANYEFVEWNTADDGTGTGYNPGDTFNISANTTLYAIWNQVDFPVTYNKNGGTGTMTDANSPYDKNDTVTVLANGFTAPAGKEFVEWNTAQDGSGQSYNPGDTFTITETTTLYAQWQTIVDDGSHITWDLSAESYKSASASQIVWETSKLTMTVDKAGSTTDANNYCPPTRTSTRFYKDSTLTFAVAEDSGIKITSIVFTSTSSDYATGLTSGSWTNATASASGTAATITPSSGKGIYGQDIVGTVGATSGNTQVQITYEYLPVISVSPASIVVEANGSNTTTLSYDHFTGSEVPTITASVTSGSALTASAVSQSGTTITVTAGASTGTVVFTLTGTISAQSATATLTVEVVSSIIVADHIDVEEGSSVVTYKGTNKSLTITVLGENDDEASNQNVTCTSSDTDILTVTNAGVITPKAKGVATVTILDQDELCTPVVVNVRVREKTIGDAKEIGVLDMTDYSKTSEGATIASSHYTAKNSFASPTGMSLADNYYAEESCVRLGKNGGAGSITITFASVKVTRVDVKAKLWSGDSGLLTVTNGSTTGSFSDSAYNTVSYSLSSSVSSITITAAGKPRFYVESVTLYSERVDITSESDTQACYTFEETYMHLDDYNSNLGYCNDVSHNYYGKNTDSGAKAHFNSLTAEQRELFTTNATFADAWARLQAWAAANGESLNGSNQLASARILPTIIDGNDRSAVSIIVIISMVSLTAIGGYFFLRKRKEVK